MSPNSQSRLGVNPSAQHWRPPPGYANIDSTVMSVGGVVGGVGNAMWSQSTQGTALGKNSENNAKRNVIVGEPQPVNASMDLDADLKDVDDLLNFSSLFAGSDESHGLEGEEENSSNSTVPVDLGLFSQHGQDAPSRNSAGW